MGPLNQQTVSSHTPPILQTDLLRRQIPAEFRQIEEMIKASIVLDPLTLDIADWLKSFRDDFEHCSNAEIVYRTYAKDLQDMLRDPATGAPLDDPLLGVEDGFTYGSKSMIVTRDPWPESERNLSPMTGQPLTLVPHPLAGFMILWLAQRGDALYSQELEKAYYQVVAKREAASKERIEYLRQMHLQCEQVQQEEQDSEFQRLQQRLARMKQEHQLDLQRLAEMVQSQTEPLQQLQREIQQEAARPRILIADVKQHMQRLLDENITSLENRVDAYATHIMSQLTQIADSEEKQFEDARNRVRITEHRVSQIKQKNNELEKAQEKLQQNVEKLKHEQQLIDGHIQQLRNNRKKRNKLRVQNMIISGLVTFGCACAGIPLSVNFSEGGVGLGYN